MDVTWLGDGLRHANGPILEAAKSFLAGSEADHDVEDGLRWESYYRDGCEPSAHLPKERMRVLLRDLPAMGCLKCGSRRVRIVYKQGNVHPMSGDAYYDVELRCSDCGEYSVYSYAEN